MAWLADAGVSDARAFVAPVVRLDPAAVVRLDPAALVRLRRAEEGSVALWSRLPWGVLVTRSVPGSPGSPVSDRTVLGADLLKALDVGLPAARDTDWRWSLPSSTGTVVE